MTKSDTTGATEADKQEQDAQAEDIDRKQDDDIEEGSLLLDKDEHVNSLEKIYEVFAASARRWETIVYPSLVAFIILAVYGFYLIYSLTSDVDKVVTEMRSISSNMNSISSDIHVMARSVDDMKISVDNMQGVMGQQLIEMKGMNTSIVEMNKSFHFMTVTMDQMRRDLSVMNHNVSRPMNFMNSFMPW